MIPLYEFPPGRWSAATAGGGILFWQVSADEASAVLAAAGMPTELQSVGASVWKSTLASAMVSDLQAVAHDVDRMQLQAASAGIDIANDVAAINARQDSLTDRLADLQEQLAEDRRIAGIRDEIQRLERQLPGDLQRLREALPNEADWVLEIAIGNGPTARRIAELRATL